MDSTILVPVGLGLTVIGAGLGIGKFAAAAAEGIARQPEAADKISGAVQLPLFLLEGVAILAEDLRCRAVAARTRSPSLIPSWASSNPKPSLTPQVRAWPLAQSSPEPRA